MEELEIVPQHLIGHVQQVGCDHREQGCPVLVIPGQGLIQQLFQIICHGNFLCIMGLPPMKQEEMASIS